MFANLYAVFHNRNPKYFGMTTATLHGENSEGVGRGGFVVLVAAFQVFFSTIVSKMDTRAHHGSSRENLTGCSCFMKPTVVHIITILLMITWFIYLWEEACRLQDTERCPMRILTMTSTWSMQLQQMQLFSARHEPKMPNSSLNRSKWRFLSTWRGIATKLVASWKGCRIRPSRGTIIILGLKIKKDDKVSEGELKSIMLRPRSCIFRIKITADVT